eukprot:scaffold113016_cov27-Prasinocladus_malaysianus.AAC.1
MANVNNCLHPAATNCNILNKASTVKSHPPIIRHDNLICTTIDSLCGRHCHDILEQLQPCVLITTKSCNRSASSHRHRGEQVLSSSQQHRNGLYGRRLPVGPPVKIVNQ